MELVRGKHNLRPRHRSSVATIGNFDGVHLGHQAVLRKLFDCANAHGLPATVIVFEPQPAEYFAAGPVPARLTSLREKFMLFDRLGVDRLMVLKFDSSLAAMPASDFAQQLLIDGLGIRGMIVGDDFKFGSDRRGDFELLRRFAARFKFPVVRTDSLRADDERVSSTRIRAVLRAGNLRDAARMLGHDYFIAGRVVHGFKRGRQMGFPTANLPLRRSHPPLAGIFAARVSGLAAAALPAIAYVGTRPIVGGTRWVLEVHVFDYDEDCYGRHIEVAFVDKIRDDLPFESFAVLSRQIAQDCESARAILDRTG